MAVALAAIAGTALVAPAAVAADDVPHELDNPPGCTTATAEDYDGCGAQGRDHFGNAGHRPPIEACGTSTSPAGSTITRIVPTGPTRDGGALAFTSGACVYLPPGYGSGELRYPVVYLLHGGGGDQADWHTFGQAQRILDEAFAKDRTDAVIAVMPDGRSGQWYDFLDRTFLNETYVLRHLVPAVDARFRTIADRTGRAVVGLSNGGYGALHLAAKAPDLFVAAGSMSGNLGARTFSELGDAQRVYHQGNVPYQLASNLDEVDLVIDWGATCTSDLLVDGCATWVFEQAFRGDNVAFRQRLDEVGYRGTVDYREAEGAHAWRWWTRWLADRHLPFVLARLADPTSTSAGRSPIPASFRYRSIFDRFAVWGYEVSVQRDAREFLDLSEVRESGFTIQGSGRAVVTTAGRYTPGSTYAVEGATDGGTELVADPAGRLRIEVDLGPSHAREQFSPEGDLDAAAAGAAYWTVRTVTIRPLGDPPAGVASGPLGSTGGSVGMSLGSYAPSGAASSTPGARPAALAAPATEPPPARAKSLGAIANAGAAEIVHRVSIPLTVGFVAAAAGATGLWWRRRTSAGRAS